MNEYLIRAVDSEAYPEENFRSVVHTGRLGADAILDILHPTDPTLPGDSLIGGWNQEGAQVAAFDQTAFELIRPLGNHPSRELYDENGDVIGQTRGGDATKQLLFHHFSGWGQRQLGAGGTLYPADNEPFAIALRHKEWTGQIDPGWNGWGWRAEIVGSIQTRDPGVHAIGVYSDSECTQYEYTTGAFVQGPSDWQIDDKGDPLTVWYTETPLGRAVVDKKDWHVAVLEGSAQKGYETLGADEDEEIYNFWEETQSPPSSGARWVDTGATVIAQAGTLYRISDAEVASALIPGQKIRFGDDAETTFTGVWVGGADYLEIDPFVQAQIGDALWSWE